MQCKDCPYCYKADGDEYPRCQFFSIAPFDIPPCEYDDEYAEEDLDPYGY